MKRQVEIRTNERLIYSANITTGDNSIIWQLEAPALVAKAASSGIISSAITPAVLVVENTTGRATVTPELMTGIA